MFIGILSKTKLADIVNPQCVQNSAGIPSNSSMNNEKLQQLDHYFLFILQLDKKTSPYQEYKTEKYVVSLFESKIVSISKNKQHT